jgi:DNA mismatch endonuclease (patch repair protein)
MADTRTPEQRRRIMQSIGTRNTGPEWTVRRVLHSRGYRYRLHRKDLPGKPDIVLPSQKKAIFVHGCFWHAHGCAKGQAPKSKQEYWGPKLEANVARDKRNVRDLEALGWLVLTLWECETKEEQILLAKLLPFVEKS